MKGRLARRARRAAKARGVPLRTRERLAVEILDHLEDSARDYRAAGLSRRQAERLAVRDFGEVGKVRQDIGRAWRGKRTVLFPEEPGQRLAHFRLYDLTGIVLILAIVFLLRWQVVAAYHIPTKSMEPTLHGDPADGDKILVFKLFYDFHDPERWQMAVFEKENDDRNLIKRIVGLPGETIDVRNGDIYVDGKIVRKPPDVQRALLVPVYEDGKDCLPSETGLHGLAAWTRTGTWTKEGGSLVCAAGPEGKASLAWSRPIPDAYPGGGPRSDGIVVGDLVLRFTVEPREGAKVVGAVLREGQDVFELRLPVGTGDAVLLRNKDEVARAAGVFLPRGELRRIRFANLDDRVTVEVDGKSVLRYDVANASTADEGDAPVAEFGIGAGRAAFSRVALERDIYYLHEGKLPTHVPEGQYFMMGDNSGNSSDSRDWGTVPRERLIGHPLAVFWPPSRAKILH